MPTVDNRYFYVGETVYVRAKVSRPGTKVPIDPDAVVLVTLLRAGATVPETVPGSFGRLAEGDYSLGIATDDLIAGTYAITVRVVGPDSDSPIKVVLVKDRFVLKAA